MAQLSFSFEQILAGLANSRREVEIAPLCNGCSRSWLSSVIPIPKQNNLRFGYIPSSLEHDHIVSELREEEGELEALDKEIARLEDALVRMRTGRTWLLHRMRQRKSAVSAIRRLPIEIWDMIFKWAGLMAEFALDFSESGCREKCLVSLPYKLSWVCKGWGRIAESIPVIWSSIRLRKLPYLKTDIRPLLLEYISKSSGHPLRVSLLDEDFEDPTPSFRLFCNGRRLSSLQQDVFLLLMREAAARCEELEFYLDDYEAPRSLLNEVIDFPILRSLRANVLATSPDKMYGWFLKILKQAPHLTCLSTRKFPYRDIPHEANLTVLEIINGEFCDLPRLLHGCKGLESLVVDQLCIPILNHTNLAEIELPHLRTMHLSTIEDPSRMVGLFDCLKATSLADLRLGFFYELDEGIYDGPISWPQASLIRMLGRHASSIIRLEMEIIRPDMESMPEELSLVEIVHAVPGLAQLKLDLEIFKDSPEYERVLRRLEEVIIHFSGGNRLRNDEAETVAKRLLEVAESRTRERLGGVDGAVPMSTICVALGDMDDNDGIYPCVKSERWNSNVGSEDGGQSSPLWSALVSSRAITERELLKRQELSASLASGKISRA
ncbi:hypothetical protein PQX77_012391 [Marasmius sp. AFHP31]|nr:hypothetical protein PQX77_013192 [Marasmius sp. AFHP31]KAK1224362.1 hypothetical protein PQX77_012746 [Marasmius sp. AFHP31]KAK1224718.1 hypothetical protein PQX77_012391 [Marasmius sp. AFHP31]